MPYLDHIAIYKEIKFANKAKKHDNIDTLVTAFAEELSHGWKEQPGARTTPRPGASSRSSKECLAGFEFLLSRVSWHHLFRLGT